VLTYYATKLLYISSDCKGVDDINSGLGAINGTIIKEIDLSVGKF
jgi:hypothetical protein